MEIKQVFDVVVTPDPQASVGFFRRCFGFDAVVDLDWYVHPLTGVSPTEYRIPSATGR
jgi:hypothetical protein